MTEIFGILTSTAAALGASAAICGTVVSAVRWFDRQSKQDNDINNIKKENMMIVSALSACLDGLTQLGANHSVTTEKDKLDRYILEQAHKR